MTASIFAGLTNLACQTMSSDTRSGRFSVSQPIHVVNAILTSLAAISGPCAFVSVSSAAIIGIVASFCYDGATKLMNKFEIDDPMNYVQINGAGGAWGLIVTGIFHN